MTLPDSKPSTGHARFVSAPCGLREWRIAIGLWRLAGFVLRIESLFCSRARYVQQRKTGEYRWPRFCTSAVGPFSQTRERILACTLRMSQKLGSQGTMSRSDCADPL
jgi:hypothetical protein